MSAPRKAVNSKLDHPAHVTVSHKDLNQWLKGIQNKVSTKEWWKVLRFKLDIINSDRIGHRGPAFPWPCGGRNRKCGRQYSKKPPTRRRKYRREWINPPRGGASPIGRRPRDCPLCGKPMRRRKSSKGEFWGCSAYPGLTLPPVTREDLAANARVHIMSRHSLSTAGVAPMFFSVFCYLLLPHL